VYKRLLILVIPALMAADWYPISLITDASSTSLELPSRPAACYRMTATGFCPGGQAEESKFSNQICRDEGPLSIKWIPPKQCENGANIQRITLYTLYTDKLVTRPDPPVLIEEGGVLFGVSAAGRGSTGITVPPPDGVVDGMELRLIVARRNDIQAVNTPSGWTQERSETRVGITVFSKVASSEEPVFVSGVSTSTMWGVMIALPAGSRVIESKASATKMNTRMDYPGLDVAVPRFVLRIGRVNRGDATIESVEGFDEQMQTQDGGNEFGMTMQVLTAQTDKVIQAASPVITGSAYSTGRSSMTIAYGVAQ
jgi:hypothetical protein